MIDLHHVVARFPQRANEIRQLCLQDETFRSICEDLALARASLPHAGAGPGEIGRDAAEELRLLRDDLETELLAYLDRRAESLRPEGQGPGDGR